MLSGYRAGLIPGYYYETPAIARVSPMLTKPDASGTSCPLTLVGSGRWRFTSLGIGEVRSERVRGEAVLVLADPIDNRKVIVCASLANRLTPARDLPEPYLYPETPMACCRCARVLRYPAGLSPAVGIYEHPSILRPSEWAGMTIASKSTSSETAAVFRESETAAVFREYILCNRCVPEGWVYCGWCRCVHAGWASSPVLMLCTKRLVLASQQGTIPPNIVTTDRGGGVRLASHLDERVQTLVEYIGRGTVCKRPDPNLSVNVRDYLAELSECDGHFQRMLGAGLQSGTLSRESGTLSRESRRLSAERKATCGKQSKDTH